MTAHKDRSRTSSSLPIGVLFAICVVTEAAWSAPAHGHRSQVADVAQVSALSTVAQRHIVRLQPPGHRAVLLMAVANDAYSSAGHYGLLWYRSDDDGATWRYYRDAFAAEPPIQPNLAVYDTSKTPQILHLTGDLVAVGNDVAAVYSYDTTRSAFPSDAWDPQRKVYFQWWRFDGTNDWNGDPLVTVASVTGAQAYHRAEIARDSLGRLWIQAFLRQNDCSNAGVDPCLGDVLQVWVSTDGGFTFQGPQNLATLTKQIGGGRLSSLGSKLIMLWDDYSTS
ncbi:MAG TPA: hypothetical protein VG496_04540, partial [Myxococcales bacterium]|nr:hypothetical protein [Myxococcales bacterium]